MNRRAMRILVLLLLGVIALPASAPGQGCSTCHDTGLRPCKHCRRISKILAQLEAAGIRHSAYLSCPDCAGTGFVDCPQCTWFETHSQRWKEWHRRVASNRKWLAEKVEKYDKRMGRECLVGESRYFVMIWDLDKLKVGRRTVRKNDLLTLYLQRMEALRKDYLQVFHLSSGSVAAKTLVMVWKEVFDQRRAGALWVEISNDRGAKFYGPNPVYTTRAGDRALRTDEQIHRNLVHNVAHLLFSSQSPPQWTGNIKGGWVDAGIAHYFEDRYWKICDNYCYVEVNTMSDFKGGKWRPAVRALVLRKKTIPIVGIVRKNTDELLPQEHAQAFSYCDFLIARDPKRFVRLVQMLKEKAPTRVALKKTFGMNLFEMERQWKAYVRKVYPPR